MKKAPQLCGKCIIVINLQVFALTLIPLFSGSLPGSAVANPDLLSLLGVQPSITTEFMVGHWRYIDHFYRWGITDKKKATVQRFDEHALMSLRDDGTMRMIKLFRPSEGRWEMTAEGIRFYNPEHPERGSQTFPVKKRDDNRIWLLLPFSGGAVGIGLARITAEDFSQEIQRAARKR